MVYCTQELDKWGMHMRLLFEIDTKDYNASGKAFVRPSARCIAIRNHKVAMVHSEKYHYYKFPGGGIEPGESRENAMIRETLEEAGLAVIPATVQEFGYVHRVQKSAYKDTEYFVQDNFYYLCQVEDAVRPQNLCGYESEEQFTLVWVDPTEAILVNRSQDHGPKDRQMLEREARVLELLMENGRFQ